MSETKRTSSHSAPDGKRPDEPSLYALKGLAEHIKHRSVKEAKRSVYGFRSLYLDSWTETPSHTEFYDSIRIISRREGVSRNMLGTMSNRENLAYFLGMLAGIAYMSRELYTAEMQDEQILSICAQNETVEKILRCLHNTNGGHGMYHADLADKIGLSFDELTEAMKELLQCRDVAANGTGGYTYYVLGPTANRYYGKKANVQEVECNDKDRDAS